MTARLPIRVRSFRVRIALLSALVSASVLLVFGFWTWTVVQRASLRRIDQSIRELGERHLGLRLPRDYWSHAQESLEFVLGDLKDNPFILLAKGREGDVRYATDNWPAELPADAFPTPIDMGFQDAPEPWEPRLGTGGPERRHGLAPPFTRSLAMPLAEGAPEKRGEFPGFAPPGAAFPPMLPPLMPIRSQAFFTCETGPNRWRVGVMSNPEVTLALGLSLAPHETEMDRLRRFFLLAAPAALLFIALSGWWVAQRALRPLRALTEMAGAITAQGLSQRIPMGQEDVEFDRLIRVFNDMLDRLEASFQQAVRFSADAAHELKTPLTILQGELTHALQSAPADSEHQQTLAHLLEELQRLKSITRKLLLLSLADSGQLKPNTEPINLSEAIEALGEDAQILGPGLRVEVTITPDLWVSADRDLLRLVLQNLVSNAVKYNDSDGRLVIGLDRESDLTRLSISNSGPGIPEDERDRVFERFYRSDKARNRRVDGVGLGLSLAREVVRVHGGVLLLEEARENWTSFALLLPIIAPPDTPPSASPFPGP